MWWEVGKCERFFCLRCMPKTLPRPDAPDSIGFKCLTTNLLLNEHKPLVIAGNVLPVPRVSSGFGSEHARQPATPNIYRYIKVYIENDKISLFVCLIFKWTHDRATYDNKCHNQMSWSRIIEIERIMVLLVCSKHSRYWYVERLIRSSEGEPLSWHFNFSNGRCELSAWNNGKKIQFPTSNDLIDFLRTRRFQYTLQPLSAVAPHKVSDIIKTVWWFCATRIKAEPEFSHVESDKMHHSPNRYRVVHT